MTSTKRTYTYEVYRDRAKEFRWRAVWSGTIRADSGEGYPTKAKCLSELRHLLKGAVAAVIVDLTKGKKK